MHSEAEESKEGMILISQGPAKFCGGMWRKGVVGEQMKVIVSCGYFVRFPCSLLTPLELHLPIPVRGWEEGSDLAQPAHYSLLFRFLWKLKGPSSASENAK